MSRLRRIFEVHTPNLLRNCYKRVYTSNAGTESYSGAPKFSRVAKTCFGLFAGSIASFGALIYALEKSVKAAHVSIHPPSQLWGFRGVLSSLDHSSIRRGWVVYKTVCSACHSLQYVSFKDLVDVCFTEQEARNIAAEYEIEDGPDENGEYFTRPGKLPDKIPSPYPNEESARSANNGAYPVDLSYIINARHNGENYVFGLLTGYVDPPPAGVELRDGQAFNPYFEGGSLGMAEMLQDDLVDYDDGTPAFKSQMAKDVVEFLHWTSNQDWDSRKVVCLKGIGICLILLAAIYPLKRQRFSIYKTTRICYIPKEKKDC